MIIIIIIYIIIIIIIVVIISIIIIIIVIIIIIIIGTWSKKWVKWTYRCAKFVDLSMSSLSVFSYECSTFWDMISDIGIDKK